MDYRLAPEHPYPAALDDVLAVLAWVVADAGELGIDTDRLAVAGSSAGGALAARVAQCAADGSVPPLVFQLLHQPVLDDRPSPSKDGVRGDPGIRRPRGRADVALLPWRTTGFTRRAVPGRAQVT